MANKKNEKKKGLIDKAINKVLEEMGILTLRFLKAYGTELKNNLRLKSLKPIFTDKKTRYIYCGISIIHCVLLFGNGVNWKLSLTLTLTSYFLEKSFIDMIKTYQFKLKHKGINKAFNGAAYVVSYKENNKLGTQEYTLNTFVPVREILSQKDKIEHYLNRYIYFQIKGLRSVIMTTSAHYLKGTEGKILKILNDNYKIPSIFSNKTNNDFETNYYFECEIDNIDKLLSKTKDIAYKLKVNEKDLEITKDIGKVVFSLRRNDIKVINLFSDNIKIKEG